jgi:hypothetical protein
MANQPSPKKLLRELFERNGYVRTQNAKRLEDEGYMAYKKGAEVRLALFSKSELKDAQRAMKALQFAPGNPYEKNKRFILPIYGKEATERFLKLIKSKGN